MSHDFDFSGLSECFKSANLGITRDRQRATFTPVQRRVPAQDGTRDPFVDNSLNLFFTSPSPISRRPGLGLEGGGGGGGQLGLWERKERLSFEKTSLCNGEARERIKDTNGTD